MSAVSLSNNLNVNDAKQEEINLLKQRITILERLVENSKQLSPILPQSKSVESTIWSEVHQLIKDHQGKIKLGIGIAATIWILTSTPLAPVIASICSIAIQVLF